jgi:hypothetical protein
MKTWLLCLALLPLPLAAQEMGSAPGGTIRFLDKISGQVNDIHLMRGMPETRGRLTITLDECRYPKDNPAADAQAHLTVVDNVAGRAAFNGWMLASSPALSAMDHARYDIWVLSCDSGFVAPDVEASPETPEEPLEEINEG